MAAPSVATRGDSEDSTPSMSVSNSSLPSSSGISTPVPGSGGGPKPHERTFEAYPVEKERRATTVRDVYIFLVAFRILNAFCVRTFFQPDEFFQSLEPAWQIAFGKGNGAWITWEWHQRLRSSLHPYMFAGVYWAASRAATLLHFTPTMRAELLLAAPKILQAFLAANMDFYTWRFAERIYGKDSYRAWAALALSVCSAWQWFCSTRTLSNCLETALTIMALEAWPWDYSLDNEDPGDEDLGPKQAEQEPYELETLWRSLGLAAIACIIRPTNVLIWLPLAWFALFRRRTQDSFLQARLFSNPLELSMSWPSLGSSHKQDRILLIREAVICGGIMLGLGALLDHSYYEQWTFPPLRFLYFNIAQSLAVFYGKNDWHYYLSQGFPLLLTTYIPFALIGLYRALQSFQSGNMGSSAPGIRYQLSIAIVICPLALSFISHKEVRFIYPLLPILHVLAAQPAAACFEPVLTVRPRARHVTWWHYRPTIIPLILMVNVLISIFTTQMHQLGPISVMDFLRREHERYYLLQPPAGSYMTKADPTMTVGFLMPCHSTPWRSHLIYPSIKAWALGCEPPVGLDAAARKNYVDEADEFYADPEKFLRLHLGKPPARKTVLGRKNPQEGSGYEGNRIAWDGKPGKKVWPEYLVFFEALEPTIQHVTRNSGYSECWRGWSSWVHDDWRRKGDIVVMCSHAVHPHPRPIGA